MNAFDNLPDTELLSLARPHLPKQPNHKYVRAFVRRVQKHLRQGKTPDETAQQFDLTGYDGLNYWLKQAQVQIESKRKYMVKRKVAA